MLRAEASAVGVGLSPQAYTPSFLKTALALAAITALCAPVAYMSMFSGFHAYDDEGIFLVTLRDFLSGHPVLTPYVPLYGPFFYEFMGGLFKVLGIQPTHDSGRWVTLVLWLIASVMSGLAVLRLTRRLWLALGAQVATFVILDALAHEPMSTYGLSSLLLLSMTGAAAFRSTWPRATAVLIGAIVGALLLIKVNVGGFAAIAVAFAWAGGLNQRQTRLAFPAIAILIAALPLVLTAGRLSRDSVLEFAILSTATAAAVAVSCIASRPRPLPPPAGRWLAGGATFIAIGSIGIALAGGSRVEDGWNSLFLFAIKFPGVFTFPVDINPIADAWGVLSLAAAVGIVVRGRRTAAPDAAVGMVRIGVGLFTWVSILLLPTSIFLLALPLAWLATQAVRGDVQNPVEPYCRLLLPALAVLESLQAYPVAGTQLSLAALGLMPVAAIILNDGIRQVRQLDGPPPKLIKAAARAAAATLLTTVAVLLSLGLLVRVSFSSGTPLGLPGARSVRLPVQQAAQLRAVVNALDRNNCSSVITFPGMNSFYVWTTEDGLRQMRYGQWWLTVDGAQQQSIVHQLQDQTNVCVVKNQTLIDFWTQGRTIPTGPLVDFIDQNFAHVGSYGDYEVLIRR